MKVLFASRFRNNQQSKVAINIISVSTTTVEKKKIEAAEVLFIEEKYCKIWRLKVSYYFLAVAKA